MVAFLLSESYLPEYQYSSSMECVVVKNMSKESDIICIVCGWGDDEGNLILCDGCDVETHTFCLTLSNHQQQDHGIVQVVCESTLRRITQSMAKVLGKNEKFKAVLIIRTILAILVIHVRNRNQRLIIIKQSRLNLQVSLIKQYNQRRFID